MQPAPPSRVLCAEDNLQVLDLLGRTVRAGGHEVQLASDGLEAMAKIEKNPGAFDLIVTDSQMPGLDGFGLVEQACAAGYRGKFIVFAAALSPEDRERYRSLRVDRIIDKPGLRGELMDAIAELATVGAIRRSGESRSAA